MSNAPRSKQYFYNIALEENLIKGGWRNFTIKELKDILIKNFILDENENLIKNFNLDENNIFVHKTYDNNIGLKNVSKINEEFVMFNFDEYSDTRLINDNNVNYIILSLKDIINVVHDNLLDKNVFMQLRLIGNKEFTAIHSTTYQKYDDLISSIDNFVFDLNEKYDDDDFIILYASVNYIVNTSPLIGEYRVNEEKANEKWVIIDHITRKNCMFVCINVGLKWVNNVKLLTDGKHRVSDTDNSFLKDYKIPKYIKEHPCLSYVDELAKICKINIHIYNSIYNLTRKHIYDPKLMTINIQICCDNHAKLLLDKQTVLKKHPHITNEYIINNNKIDKSKHKHFLKVNYDAVQDNKIIAWDIETYENHVYAISIYNNEHKAVFSNKMLLEKLKKKQTSSNKCMKRFLQYIKDNSLSLNNHTFYAHNGSKYDLIFLLKEVMLYDDEIHIIKKSVIETNNRFLNLSIRIHTSIITFKDSYALLPYSLSSLCESFNTEHSKISISIDKLTKLDNILENYDDVITYNKYDVISLYEILIAFSIKIFDLFRLNITKSTTIASLARNILRTEKYYSDELYNLPDYVENFIKKSYFGGRTECFKLGHIENTINCYDINSSYIYAATKTLPLGKSIRIKDTDINSILSNPIYKQSFVKVLVRNTNKNIIPVHPVKSKNGLVIFPILENWTEMTLYLPELKLGLLVGYEYKFIEGFYFKSSKKLKNIFEFMYNERIKYSKNNILNFVYKLIGVAIYGCFGYNVSNKSNIKISDKKSKDHIKYLEKKKLKSTSIIGNYELNEVVSEINIDRNYAIASAITSYGRIRLYQIYLDIKNKGYDIY
jgi:hypothetical protein